MVIGLSVSMCIRDIVAGKVNLADVKKIIAGTAAKGSEGWNHVISMYRQTYWRNNPDECEKVCRQLLAEEKIFQPGLTTGYRPHLVGENGIRCWVENESEIKYV
jgi:hypothetical protein